MLDHFFARLYEWFGLLHFYSRDLAEYLKGRDFTCSDYLGTPWYEYFGWLMLFITFVFYILQYYIIDSSVYNKREHWWFVACSTGIINFIVSSSILFHIIESGNYCGQLNITVHDCVGFGLSDAIWSVIAYALISSIPLIRNFSTHGKQTTFWKP